MKYYLVGIKGTGMSALALCLKNMGEMVIGSDIEQYCFTEEKLNKNKIPIFKFNKNNIKKYTSYIYIIGHSFDENNNEEVNEIINNNYEYYYYSDFINNYFKKTKIGISGTHGKTTLSTILKTMLEKEKISYIIGDGNGGGNKEYKYLILEACEYKYHFINYDYDFLLINNIDYDHPDFYNDINEVITAFKKVSKKTKCLIVNNDDINARKIKHHCRYTYGINNKSFVNGTILTENEQGYKIKINVKENEYILNLPFFGIHMIYNFLGAFTIYYLLHNDRKNIEEKMLEIIKNYQSPKRRKEEYFIKNDNIIIDDYAHHPNEIISVTSSIKQKYPNKKLITIFQPHTYTRTIFLNKQFTNALNIDNTYIMNTYKSREEYDSLKEKIVNEIYIEYKKYNRKLILDEINSANNSIFLFIGAGDISNEVKEILTIIS